MKNGINFDEKQLIDRGIAFKYGFLAALFAILLVYFLEDITKISISRYAALIITIWIPITVCTIALVLKDAYDGVNSASGRILATMFGVSGTFMLVLFTQEISVGRNMLIKDGMITNMGGYIFNGICMVTVSIVYWMKQYMNKKKYKEDWEYK